MSGYRENENLTITEELDALREKVERLEKRTSIDGEAKGAALVGGIVTVGLLLLVGSIIFGSVSCNRSDNAARVEAAKLCPAAAKDIQNERGSAH